MLTTYETRLEAARTRFAKTWWVTHLLTPAAEIEELERFMIHYSSLGVGMTEPVESWIFRAGERCEAIGLPELGRVLKIHAGHEAGHHKMMIKDTHVLVDRWNNSGRERFDSTALLARAPTGGVTRYVKLHEDVIASAAPYAQLAIEFEIERISVVYAGKLVDNCVTRVGQEMIKGLSFLEDHVALDVGHTKFNQQQLDRLLTAHPEFLEPLVAAGSEALDSYAHFLDDVCKLAAPQKVGVAA